MEKKYFSRPFKLVLSGGPYNGGIRYYSTLGIALREGSRYLHRYASRCLSDHLYFEVFSLSLSRPPILVGYDRV